MRVFQSGLIGWLAALALLLGSQTSLSDDALKQKFNHKYREFLSETSQSLLPFPELSKSEWRSIRQSKSLALVYTDPDRFYNNKTYTFRLFAGSDDGSYYLEVKGGFWGMDELVYGPLSLQQLK